MGAMLRSRLTVRRLFPCTWWLLRPAFRRTAEARRVPAEFAPLGLLSTLAMFVDLVSLPVRLPVLLLWRGRPVRD